MSAYFLFIFYVEVKKLSFSFAYDLRGSIAADYSLIDRRKEFHNSVIKHSADVLSLPTWKYFRDFTLRTGSYKK